MIISADRILIQIIEHKNVFLGIVDYVAQHDGRTEIPLALYRDMIRRVLGSPLLDKAPNPRVERQRLQDTFDLDNMQRARLVIRVDHTRNVLSFAPFVLDMLRHFDASRMLGLSQAELEALRCDLNDSLAAITKVRAPDDLQDALRMLRRRISNTLAQVQESVAALDAQTRRLSEQVEGQDIANLEEAVSIREALKEINRIYERHILPALEFLDPKTSLREGMPAVTAIRLIGDHFMTCAEPELASEMHLAAGAIQSYAHDIGAIRRSVERYVRQDRRQRQQYDQIEKAFNTLHAAAEETHDDSFRNKLISLTHPAIQRPGTFMGIRRYSFRRLEWYDIDHKADFEEFTDRRIAVLRQQHDQAGTIAIEAGTAGLSDAELTEQLRQSHIHEAMSRWQIPEGCPDLHAALHDYLRNQLEDYSLHDLLEALDWFMALPNFQCRASVHLSTLDDGNLELVYYPLKVATPCEESQDA